MDLLDRRIFILKLIQSVGGFFSVLVGVLVVLLGNNTPASIKFGLANFNFDISAVSGIVIILIGIVVIWRGAAGITIKVDKKDEKERTYETKEYKLNSEDIRENTTAIDIRCPECNGKIDSNNIKFFCTCSCAHEWKQRIPSYLKKAMN